MSIDLYYVPGSPPVRAIQMVAKAIGVNLNLKLVDLAQKEHFKPEFLKMNPQHSVPTLDDNGFYLYESRAILVYLLEKYGNGSTLWSDNVEERAIINQRLYFDIGTLYGSFSEYYYPQMFGTSPANPDNYKKIETALGFFNEFLANQSYAAGNVFTVADIALIATISSFCHSQGFLLDDRYPNVVRWFTHCKEITPGYDINENGLKTFKNYFAAINK